MLNLLDEDIPTVLWLNGEEFYRSFSADASISSYGCGYGFPNGDGLGCIDPYAMRICFEVYGNSGTGDGYKYNEEQ